MSDIHAQGRIDQLKAFVGGHLPQGFTGKPWFVGNSSVRPFGGVAGSDTTGAGTSPQNPFATIDYAIGKTTASRGDVIFVLPGHSETVTSAITMDMIGVGVVGIPMGNKLPKVIVNGAVDLITMTAASSWIANLDFAIVTTDAATAFVNVGAANCAIRNITGVGSSGTENVVDCITIASGANDLLIDGVRFFNTTVAVNSFLSIEAAVARLVCKNFFAFGDVATAGVIDAATATQIWIDNMKIGVVGTSKPAATLDSNPSGFVSNSYFSGTVTTLATNAALGTGLRLFNVLVLEETGGAAQGAPIPAVDAD
jgi:hypothetical protein